MRNITTSHFTFNVAGAMAAVVLASCCLFASAQSRTLAQMVEAAGGEPVNIPPLPHVPRRSIEELVAQSDLILRGKLNPQPSYVSEDGTEVLTDYELVPNEVYFARTPTTMPIPGQAPPFVVVLRGGDVVINGTAVSMGHSMRLPESGQAEFLIFAKAKEGETNRFELAWGGAGIFEVVPDGIRSLSWSDNHISEIDDVPFDTIVAKIRGAIPK